MAGVHLTRTPSRRGVARRRVLRVIAGVLAVLGALALVPRPSTKYRAEVRLVVPAPLATNDVVRTIAARPTEATVRADGTLVVIATSGSDRDAARARVENSARDGLDAALRPIAADADARASAARADEQRAANQLMTLVNRTGLDDPAAELQRVQAVVADLETQRRAAVAAGRPLTDIDARLADNQQAMFELDAQNRAARRARAGPGPRP